MRRSSLVLALPACLAAAALAACADSPTAPAARAPEAAPRAAFVGVPEVPGTVEVRTADGALFGGATVAFWRELKDSVHVLDNSALDLDKADGRFRVLMPTGTMYRAFLRKLPDAYANASSTLAPDVTPVNGEVQFPALTVAEKPIVRVSLLNRRKQPVLGATVQLMWYLQSMAIGTDGGAGDLAIAGAKGTNDGVITLRTAKEGEHKVCETQAPLGYALATPNCVIVNTKFGAVHKVSLFHDAGIIAPPPPAES